MVSGHRLLASQNDAGLRRILPDALGDHLIHRDAGLDDGALLNVRAREQTSRLRRMNAQTGGSLVEKTVNHVDLVLQRLERRQVLLRFMSAPGTLGVPVILVHSIPHEQNRETLRERRVRK